MSFSANSTVGEYKHQLSVEEIPSHNHSRRTYLCGYEASGYGLVKGSVGFCDCVMVSGSGDTSNKGGNGRHNNVQSYITVFF